MNNRWRQDILAMEERFVTSSYPHRLFTTVYGIMIVDAFLAHKLRYPSTLTYREWCSAAAYLGMHNDIDELARGEEPPDRRDSPLSPRISQQREKHRLVRLSSIEGWRGSKRQRCAACGGPGVGWCCVECSSAEGVVPIHRVQENDPRSGSCLKSHQKTGGRWLPLPSSKR